MEPKDGIWIIDPTGLTVYASDRMCEILGTDRAAMLRTPSFTFVFPEDTAAAQRLFDAKSMGNLDPFHFRLRRADGSEVWVDVQGTPMHNAKGVFSGIVGTFTVSE